MPETGDGGIDMDLARAPATARPPGTRDQRIDFLRGLALIFIFVDHVPDSPLSILTLRSYAFADAAEMFFFVSGYVAATVYGGRLETEGFVAAAARIWRRVWVLYAAQILLFGFLAAVVWLGVAGTGHSAYRADFGLSALVSRPDRAILHALLLHYQPAYLDILPVYVLLLMAFPLVLVGLARSMWIVLAPSAALYAAVQIWAVTPVTFPDGEGWFFNPLAWQFLFVLGAAFGHPRLRGGWRFLGSERLLRAALVLSAVVAAMQFPEALRMIWPGIPSLKPFELPLDKSALEPLRLVSFLSLALIAARYVPPAASLRRSRFARLTMRCGQHSLHIFCLGVLLAAAGEILAGETGHSLVIQLAFTVAGIAALFGFAVALERLRVRGARPFWITSRRSQPA